MSITWQWDDVRFFLAVAREGSLSRAGRTLGVDHVRVARRIAQLEARLSTKLLNRTPDGYVTTPAGQVILSRCEEMEGAALDVERMVAGQDTRVAGSVRITATDAVACRLVVPVIAALRRKHPELQIDLIPGVRTLNIARREADLAVRMSSARPDDPGLVIRKLGEIGFTLYASREYLASRGIPRRGHGLARHDLICYMAWSQLAGPFFMGESAEGARIAVRSNAQFVQLKATADGLGISELPCYFGDASSEVVRVWPDASPTLRPVWLVTHEDLRRAARIRLVSSAIADAFERDAKILRNGPLRRSQR